MPEWDARGLGPLPWQGIACADLSADGRFIALGTIALPGDMNVFVLDEQGKLLRQYSAGRRWINEVAAGDRGAFVAALCTTLTGTAGDCVLLSIFAGNAKPEEINPDQPVFHYGANSNHLAPCVSAMGDTLAVLAGNGVRWSSPAGAQKPSSTYVPGADRAMAFAASPAGLAVVATVSSADDAGKAAPNLFLLKRGEPRPICSIVADLSVRPDGGAAVSCWNGRIYILDAQLKPAAKFAEGIDVGGPAIVDAAADGRILVAGSTGIVRLFAPDGTERWTADLNKLATPGDKPWTRNRKAGKISDGVWRTNGGLAHSDMGGQYVIEAPDGLIMVDPNGGLSFEQNWAKIAPLEDGRVDSTRRHEGTKEHEGEERRTKMKMLDLLDVVLRVSFFFSFLLRAFVPSCQNQPSIC